MMDSSTFSITFFDWVSPLKTPVLQIAIILFLISCLSIIVTHHKKLPPGSPPLVPYKIPWLGHAIEFARDNNGFIGWATSQFPRDGITTVVLAGKTIYLVTSTELASSIYRSSKSFAFDPLALLVSEVFGCSRNDMKILSRGTNDYAVQSRDEDEKEPLMKKLHHMSASYLKGESLDRMTDIFIQTLTENLEGAFPEDGDWVELDLRELVKRHFSLASIASLFGTKILEREGEEEIYDWLWDFDLRVSTLIAKIPDLVVGKAAKSRDAGLEMLLRWERAAKEAERQGLIDEDQEDNRAWDEDWGLSFTRDRARVVEQYAISKRGRAGMQMALLWAQNANAIPVASWLAIQALSPNANPDLLAILLSEIAASVNPIVSNTPSIDPRESVNDLSTAVKQLFNDLSLWSQCQATKDKVLIDYGRITYELNIALQSFKDNKIETEGRGDYPKQLRALLDPMMEEGPSVVVLEKYLPRIKETITTILQFLNRKHDNLCNKKSWELSSSEETPINIKGQNSASKIDFELLNKQPHLNSLLQEAFRYATSSPGVRVVQSDTQVGPYALKKGGLVIIHARSLQLDSSIWGSNAHVFDPYRFLDCDIPALEIPSQPTDIRGNKRLRQQSMRQFGGGQNLCPGRFFASNEILGGFAVLLKVLEIELSEDERERVTKMGMPSVELGKGKQGGLWPDRGFSVRARRRRI